MWVDFELIPDKVGRHRVTRIDRDAIATPDGQQPLHDICRGIPMQPWSTNVHRHYAAIERHLRLHLPLAFPAARGVCRTSYFGAQTWSLRQRRVWLRKHIARLKGVLAKVEAVAALKCWAGGIRLHAARLAALPTGMTLCRQLQGLTADLAATKAVLRASIRADRAKGIHEAAVLATSSLTADVVRKLRPLLGPPKRRARGRQALPKVVAQDGRILQTAAEVEEAWIHFSGIEAGVKSDPVTLAALCQQRQSEQDLESYILALEDVPTRADLEASLRRTHTGRASGLDDVPGEVWHFAAHSASRALFQLFLKCSLRAAEPLQWKGGRLVATWKGKQNPALCFLHRGILISSTAGKSVHSLVGTAASQHCALLRHLSR